MNPRLAEAHNDRGNVGLSKADTDGAVSGYRRRLEVDPAMAQAYYDPHEDYCGHSSSRGDSKDT